MRDALRTVLDRGWQGHLVSSGQHQPPAIHQAEWKGGRVEAGWLGVCEVVLVLSGGRPEPGWAGLDKQAVTGLAADSGSICLLCVVCVVFLLCLVPCPPPACPRQRLESVMTWCETMTTAIGGGSTLAGAPSQSSFLGAHFLSYIFFLSLHGMGRPRIAQ